MIGLYRRHLKEIVRRYFNEMCNYKLGITNYIVPERVKKLMNELGIDEYYLDVVKPALEKSKREEACDFS